MSTWNQKRTRLNTFAANCSDVDGMVGIVATQLGWNEHFARLALMAEMERLSLGDREAEETARLMDKISSE